MQLKPVQPTEQERFRLIAEAYWQELMPHADVLQSAEQQERYFQEEFTWAGGDQHPHWAMRDGQIVGFVSFSLDQERKTAYINDFYILPEARRQGNGVALLQALYRRFDEIGVECVELSVRRDNPRGLAFWEAQGFRIGSYRMRQYRDPKTGQAFIGALSSDFA
ncbi:MAG: GNAT family N-acetyltransferase [Caldilineaceae bacterium]